MSFDLNDGLDNHSIALMRIHGHMTRMIGYFLMSHAEIMTVMDICGP